MKSCSVSTFCLWGYDVGRPKPLFAAVCGRMLHVISEIWMRVVSRGIERRCFIPGRFWFRISAHRCSLRVKHCKTRSCWCHNDESSLDLFRSWNSRHLLSWFRQIYIEDKLVNRILIGCLSPSHQAVNPLKLEICWNNIWTIGSCVPVNTVLPSHRQAG
jgi:hypothetical protein